MPDYMEVAYPDKLLKSNWDKAKGVLAKRTPTGIGEALGELKKLHDDRKWSSNFQPGYGGVTKQEERLIEWPKVYKSGFSPLLKKADEVKVLAEKGAALLEKDKLAPKSSAKAALEVARASTAYRQDLEDFEGLYARAMSAKLDEYRGNIRKMIKPSLVKGVDKCNALISDIKAYAGKPSKEAFFQYFSGDSNARGYCTVLKSVDQLLAEFPDIRDKGFTKGDSLVRSRLPAMELYGANKSEKDFEAANKKLGLSDDTAWRHHARQLVVEVPNIQALVLSLRKVTAALG